MYTSNFQKTKEFLKPKNLKQKYEQYERYLTSGALILGFIVDSLTLKRIDLPFETFVLFTHLVIIGTVITLFNLHEGGVIKWHFFDRARIWLLIIMQFSFGALFSAFFVFYSRSASLSSSWPFLLILVGLLIGNESFRQKYAQMVFRMTILFIALFTFTIFYVPVVLKQMGAWIFLLSGAISLLVMALFVGLLSLVIKEKIKKVQKTLAWSIGGVFLIINILYFTNIIPPIPLSLKSAEVYHSVQRVSGGYSVLDEEKKWYEFLRFTDRHHITSGEAKVSVFSSVFAPTDFKTNIVHQWQFFNETNGKWQTMSEISFAISGGREEGFRGYSNRQVTPGVWRVNIKTPRGQLIGRKKFEVIRVNEMPEIEREVI